VKATNIQGDLFDTKVKFLQDIGLSLSIESIVLASLGMLAETIAVLLLLIPGRLEQESRLALLLMVSLWLQCVFTWTKNVHLQCFSEISVMKKCCKNLASSVPCNDLMVIVAYFM